VFKFLSHIVSSLTLL